MKRFLLPIYAYSLLNELGFIYSFYAVMFSDRGLSAVQISILFAVWSTTAFVLEIPSGAVADKYRKHVLLFAQASKMCCYACWMLFPTFWGFLIGFVCWGVRSAFSSGTFEALVFDELKHFSVEEDYAKVIGRTRSLATTGILIADLSATYMIRFGYHFLLLASMASLAVSFLAVLFVRPADRAESIGEAHYFALLKEGVREAVRNRVILRMIVFVSFALIFFGTLDEYWTLFYKHAGIPKAGIAPLCAVATASCVLAGVVAHRFGRLSDRAAYAAYIGSGIVLMIAAYFMRPISVVCVPLFCAVSVIINIVLDARLQQSIAGHARATVLSVRGFLSEVAAVHIYIGFGIVAHRWGYRGGFMACAGVMMLIGVLFLAFSSARSDTDSPRDPLPDTVHGLRRPG